jgi:hypothetical protein
MLGQQAAEGAGGGGNGGDGGNKAHRDNTVGGKVLHAPAAAGCVEGF